MTETINYGCAYRSKETCLNSGWRTNCCDMCYTHIGYLNVIEPITFEEIASYFLPNIGFWRANIGCILPRKYRSYPCLSYRCSKLAKTFSLSNRDRFIIDLLRTKLICDIGICRYNAIVKIRKDIYKEVQDIEHRPIEYKQQIIKLVEQAAEEFNNVKYYA